MNSLVDWLLEWADIDYRKDIVAYGLEILVDELVCLVSIICLGLLSDRLIESAIFLICLVLGAGTIGGYHCNSHKYCYLLTIVFWIISIVMIDICINLTSAKLMATSNIIYCALVWKYSPVEHYNKRLNAAVRKRNRGRGLLFDFILCGLIVTFWFANHRIGCILWINRTEVVISMMMAVIKQGVSK